VKTEVRLYDHLFLKHNPGDEKECPDLVTCLNPDSQQTLQDCRVEPGLREAKPGEKFQFLRVGYFCTDSVDSRPGVPVFNRTVTLRDTWAKIRKKMGG